MLTVQDIIRLPRLFRFLQRPLAKLISTFRAPKSKEGYASIGGGSPLRKITDEQVKVHKVDCSEIAAILLYFGPELIVTCLLVINLLTSSES